jgi:hypothetical protein
LGGDATTEATTARGVEETDVGGRIWFSSIVCEELDAAFENKPSAEEGVAVVTRADT